MVKVMPFRGREEWEMVAAMVDGGTDDNKSEPQKANREMCPSDQWASCNWQQIDKVVLQRMAVDGSYTNRSSPFVMGLVDRLVEGRIMEQPVRRKLCMR